MAPNPSIKPDNQEYYSTLEVDESAHLPEVKPVTEPPEAVNTAGKEVAPAAGAEAPHAAPATICGLRRRIFWIALAVALAVIVAVAVGAGVGATRNKSSGSSASSGTSTGTTRRGISASSKLAAGNYTDADGVQHSQVYYQANTLDIYMGDWNYDASKWTFAQVLAQNNNSAVNPKNGTPIAAYNYMFDNAANRTDFRCLFLDTDNWVRFLWAANRTGLDNGWQLSGKQDRSQSAGDNSSLVEYVPQCWNKTTTCNSADFTIFESAASDVTLFYPFGNGADGDNSGKMEVSGITPDSGTAMAVAEIPKIAKRSDPYPRVALYLSDGGVLKELYGGYDLGWSDTGLTSAVTVNVDTGAQMTAMTQYRLDDFNEQVLITKADGGVKMAYMNGPSWNSMNSVEGMEDVIPLSPIAANQLGRVYALERTSDNITVQLVEWTITTGTIPTFTRVGVVNTTLAE